MRARLLVGLNAFASYVFLHERACPSVFAGQAHSSILPGTGEAYELIGAACAFISAKAVQDIAP